MLKMGLLGAIGFSLALVSLTQVSVIYFTPYSVKNMLNLNINCNLFIYLFFFVIHRYQIVQKVSNEGISVSSFLETKCALHHLDFKIFGILNHYVINIESLNYFMKDASVNGITICQRNEMK